MRNFAALAVAMCLSSLVPSQNSQDFLDIGIGAMPESKATSRSEAKGRVVVVGGGSIPDAIYLEILGKVKPADASVCILPFASELADSLERSIARWAEIGVKQAFGIAASPSLDELQRMASADVIWIPGGAQDRFMDKLSDSLKTAIPLRLTTGGTIAGTSAGAAVASKVMIAGNGEKGESRRPPPPILEAGLDLIPGVIIDQHFSQRGRLPRLLQAILLHPTLLGIGVDESTAAIVDGASLRVVGEGLVTILDPRSAKLTPHQTELKTARDIRMHLLKEGETFDLATPSAPR
jgi:cyanophycinase